MTAQQPPYPEKLAAYLASRLREAKNDLVLRWLERISARVAISPDKLFPSDTLLNHVPVLVEGIAGYLEHPDKEFEAETPVAAKAMELGALRHSQGFDAYQILKEHEILGAIIFAFLADVADEGEIEAPRRDFLTCWQRIAHSMEVIRQATMTHFLRLSAERVNEREERLRRFNRMVSHELKNRVGAIRGAAHLIGEEWLEPEKMKRFVKMILDNSEELQRVLVNLEGLSRLDSDARVSGNVLLPQAAAEAVRQMRDQAQGAGIEITIADDIPPVEVEAATVELCLVNYLSNAIKYSDASAKQRWVRVEGCLDFPQSDRGQLTVRVRDNGIGVPLAAREKVFERFFRVDQKPGVEGSGLGLNIVRDTVESLGGRAWAEFPESGETVFAFSLPSRRSEDAAAAGTKRPADRSGEK